MSFRNLFRGAKSLRTWYGLRYRLLGNVIRAFDVSNSASEKSIMIFDGAIIWPGTRRSDRATPAALSDERGRERGILQTRSIFSLFLSAIFLA
jgi:hypothetical protein